MIEITQLTVPRAWDGDDEDARAFREYVDVRNAVMRDTWSGDDSHAMTYRESFARWIDETDQRIDSFLARVGDRAVARGYFARATAEARHIADVDIMVLPEARRSGVGTAMLGAFERRARTVGVTTLQSWATHLPASGAQLEPPTGFGTVPREAPEVRFLCAAGWTLEQVERMSELRLDASADLARLLAEAQRDAGPAYRLETWTGPTPLARRASLAALHQRMSTDAPSAGLDHEEEVWDVSRVERYEATEAKAGRTILRAVAIEEATGAVVAFTTLVVPPESNRPVYQEDTLVHGEHRGHRLGMLVKIGNLLALRERHPAARILTWNAEENRPMLRVNEAIGFTAIAYEGAWQKRLAPATMDA